MEGLEFTEMTLKDLDNVLAIEHLSFPTPWSRRSFVSELTENIYAHYVVVKQEGKVVAYSGMWVIVDEAHITNIAVHPHYRRRGIGEMLMKEMLERAKSHGALRMTLEVRVSNKTAQDLYIRLGFIATGIRRGYYSDTGEDATVMWLNDLGPGRVVDEGVRYE